MPNPVLFRLRDFLDENMLVDVSILLKETQSNNKVPECQSVSRWPYDQWPLPEANNFPSNYINM